MKRCLIAYFSRTGNTATMADHIAEGLRISGHGADVKPVAQIASEADLAGYDGYVFGSPTYHRDLVGSMKTFLFLAQKADLAGKAGGAFGSYTHSGDAPKIIFDTMEHVFGMNVTDLGSLNLKEALVGTPEGLRACQEYGKSVGDRM